MRPFERDDRLPIAILFDIDGCLISTGGAGTRSWRRAFEALHGVPADIGEFTEAGMTDPEVGRLTFTRVIGREPTDRDMARLLEAYLDRLPREVARSPDYRVMPGVDALLPRLADAGVLLGIVSGALEGAARIKLARADLNRFFCFGGYGSDSGDRRELTRLAIKRGGGIHGHTLDPKRVVVVGDTPRDIEAAHGAGAIAVGVATGRYTIEALWAAGADHALPTLQHPLPGVLSSREGRRRSGERPRPSQSRRLGKVMEPELGDPYQAEGVFNREETLMTKQIPLAMDEIARSNNPEYIIPVKVYRGDDRITIAAPMPGMEPSGIVVTVMAEHHVVLDGKRGRLYPGETESLMDEWNPGPYHRDLEVPVSVDGERANVTYNNGVLVVSLPIVEVTREARLTLSELGATHGERFGESGHPHDQPAAATNDPPAQTHYHPVA